MRKSEALLYAAAEPTVSNPHPCSKRCSSKETLTTALNIMSAAYITSIKHALCTDLVDFIDIVHEAYHEVRPVSRRAAQHTHVLTLEIAAACRDS